MKFKSEEKGNVSIISLEGDLLGQINNDLIDNIGEKIENNVVNFVIDLSGVKQINSSGIGLLIRILTKARVAGGESILANVPEDLSKMLVMTKLSTVFKVTKDTDEALSILN